MQCALMRIVPSHNDSQFQSFLFKSVRISDSVLSNANLLSFLDQSQLTWLAEPYRVTFQNFTLYNNTFLSVDAINMVFLIYS